MCVSSRKRESADDEKVVTELINVNVSASYVVESFATKRPFERCLFSKPVFRLS